MSIRSRNWPRMILLPAPSNRAVPDSLLKSFDAEPARATLAFLAASSTVGAMSSDQLQVKTNIVGMKKYTKHGRRGARKIAEKHDTRPEKV